jgi:hypothetical protein
MRWVDFFNFKNMAQKSVKLMVYNRLPFLAVTNGNNDLIDDYTNDAYFYLQPWTQYSDAVVELDDTYRGAVRILVAEVVAYNILIRKVLANMTAAESGSSAVSKHLKKGKADVVEAEFEYAKASDGNELIMEATNLVPVIKQAMCNYSASMGWYLPDCGPRPGLTIVPFQSFVPGED